MLRTKRISVIVFLALAVLDFLVWFEVFSGAPPQTPAIHFLDVGQGDATLVVLPGVKILTDAGPNAQVRRALEKVLNGGRYVDLGIISHPQLDHFGGLRELLRSYSFGAILWNGREGESGEWRDLIEETQRRNVPLLAIAAGDRIRLASAAVNFLSPTPGLLWSAEMNDTGLVQMLELPDFKMLSAADVGLEVEKRLRQDFDLAADILKVGHHGSKYSSGSDFLAEVGPALAVISVGEGNRYGHPTTDALSRLQAVGAGVFRTDERGTVSLFVQDGKVKLFTER